MKKTLLDVCVDFGLLSESNADYADFIIEYPKLIKNIQNYLKRGNKIAKATKFWDPSDPVPNVSKFLDRYDPKLQQMVKEWFLHPPPTHVIANGIIQTDDGIRKVFHAVSELYEIMKLTFNNKK